MWKRPIGGRVVLAFLVLWALPACAPKTSSQKAADDQEIATQVQWELRKDPRLSEVRVLCAGHVLTLQGRVVDPKAVEDAVRIARSWGRGAEVRCALEVRPR